MIQTKEEMERVILVGVATGNPEETEESLEELKELAKTAGAVTVAKIIQNREAIHPGTYIGKGKIDEVREQMTLSDAHTIICDDELSPAQLRNLEDALQTKVIDRTVMILDIFAAHASTSEGKIQVELAQLRYRASRLVGLRSSLSRLGGGIGTRGPGEKKLEMDRRLIKERISQLNQELNDVKQNRELLRKQRSKKGLPLVAIVGYTNAGKSTMLNYLTGAGVKEENMLFATLDPTTRLYELENGQKLLFTDTVGFIRKLPHHLIEAFRSTLEEAKYADLILHVVDVNNPMVDTHLKVVYETLSRLGVENKPVLTAWNQCDKLSEPMEWKDTVCDASVQTSAKTGQGVEELLQWIERKLNEQLRYVEKVVPYSEAGVIQQVRQYGQLIEEEYREDGIFVRAKVPANIRI